MGSNAAAALGVAVDLDSRSINRCHTAAIQRNEKVQLHEMVRDARVQTFLSCLAELCTLEQAPNSHIRIESGNQARETKNGRFLKLERAETEIN